MGYQVNLKVVSWLLCWDHQVGSRSIYIQCSEPLLSSHPHGKKGQEVGHLIEFITNYLKFLKLFQCKTMWKESLNIMRTTYNKLVFWMILQLPLSILDCYLSRGGCPLDKLGTLHSCWPLNRGKKNRRSLIKASKRSSRSLIEVATK